MINKKNKKLVNILKVGTGLAAVGAITVGITMALLSAQTEKVKNTFTPSGGIDLVLTEPNWEVDGEASHFAPGSEIPKDPTIEVPVNSSQDEYVAATVKYYVDLDGNGVYEDQEEISYSEFTSKYANIFYLNGSEVSTASKSYNTEDWATLDNSIYYYGTKAEAAGLNVFEKSAKDSNGEVIKNESKLFDTVVVNKNIPTYSSDTKDSSGKVLYKKGQPIAFKIDVKAYGVQDSLEKADAFNALNLMIEGKDPNEAIK